MKGKNGLAMFGVIFLATVLTEIYGLLRCADQLYVIIGGGVAVLITGFLFFTAIVSFQIQSQKEMADIIRESLARVEHAGLDQGSQAGKAQKENSEFLVQELGKEMSREIQDVKQELEKNRLILQEHIGAENVDLQESMEEGIASLLEGMKEIQAHTTKLLIQHNTENIGKLVAYNKKYVLYLSTAIEQLAVSGRPARRKKVKEDSLASAAVSESAAVLNKEEPVMEEAVPVVETERTVEDIPVVLEKPEETVAVEPEKTEEAVMAAEAEAEAVPEVEAEAVPAKESAPMPTLEVEGDPNKPMSPEEIAALFASASGESTAEESMPEETEKAEEPAPAPAVEMDGDPNRQMSPEEIAALFANLG